MTKDDNKLIWRALINERRNPDANTYDAMGRLPGPIAELDPAYGENEEGGCPNLDKLISQAAANEDAEVEDLNIDDEADSFSKVENETPL